MKDGFRALGALALLVACPVAIIGVWWEAVRFQMVWTGAILALFGFALFLVAWLTPDPRPEPPVLLSEEEWAALVENEEDGGA